MGKPSAKKKTVHIGLKSNEEKSTKSKTLDRSSKAFDEDTAIFITMSQELKEEGKKLFQKHDHEGAMLKYEKALKLLPSNHIDVAYLRSNMANCYMQLGIGEYPRAVNQCNLALQVAPKYSKALLRRAKCYEALNQLGLAVTDVDTVLSMEPNNSTALEIADGLKKEMEKQGVKLEEKKTIPAFDFVEPTYVKEKGKKKKGAKVNRKSIEEPVEKNVDIVVEEKKAENEVIVEEKRSVKEEKVVMKSVKLVHGEDIRGAQLPVNCDIRLVRDIVVDRFPSLKGVLIKYKDQDGDLVTITTTNELRIAEGLADYNAHLKLYIAEVNPDKEPIYEGKKVGKRSDESPSNKGKSCVVEDWIVHFARLFKNHVGFESESYLDLNEIGMQSYSEALEDSIASEDSQQLFDIAGAKFQEMTALALFNWGNVHLSKALKRSSSLAAAESEVNDAYDGAQKEFSKASVRYEESLKIKPDFYEGYLALGLQQFEQAKLTWHYTATGNTELEIGSSGHVLELYNKAEDNMEQGMQLWEEMEEKRLNGISKQEKDKSELRKFGLDGLLKDISVDEASKHNEYMRSQIYLLWGKMLYERSVIEYKLGLPSWEECLEVAVEKFELAKAPGTDIAVMVKNHCSNKTALEGFKVDEIVEAWNEMYDADRWRTGVASFRLEPLFRRRSYKF